MTVDDPKMIKLMITKNGFYKDDPQVLAIYSYLNQWSKLTQKVCMHQGHVDSIFRKGSACGSPTLLWGRDHGITDAGERWLEKQKGVAADG